MSKSAPYRIVKLASGAHSVHSLEHAETFHPVIGPTAEAQALYVEQLNLLSRLRQHSGEFVIWDIGLGAAANPITVIRAAREIRSSLRLVSFDHTVAPLQFALQHTAHLEYLQGYEQPLRALEENARVAFQAGQAAVNWELHVADFPTFIGSAASACLPKPQVIMFDAFSPATNARMWTGPLFERLFNLLDPARPCALPTYSRSTLLRVTLLIAGFFVGAGQATGEKEETTVAANTLELIRTPLDRRWLQRAQRSTSAEPLWEGTYRQAPLSEETRRRLQQHPQFK